MYALCNIIAVYVYMSLVIHVKLKNSRQLSLAKLSFDYKTINNQESNHVVNWFFTTGNTGVRPTDLFQ